LGYEIIHKYSKIPGNLGKIEINKILEFLTAFLPSIYAFQKKMMKLVVENFEQL